jgi:uncharacterized membrane protein
MSPARVVWLLDLLLLLGLLGSLAMAGRAGWAAMLPLLLMLPWLLRGRPRAFALLSLLIVLYIGGGLAFRDSTAGMAVAWLGAGLFLGATAFVRFTAVERRRAADRQGSAL